MKDVYINYYTKVSHDGTTCIPFQMIFYPRIVDVINRKFEENCSRVETRLYYEDKDRSLMYMNLEKTCPLNVRNTFKNSISIISS